MWNVSKLRKRPTKMKLNYFSIPLCWIHFLRTILQTKLGRRGRDKFGIDYVIFKPITGAIDLRVNRMVYRQTRSDVVFYCLHVFQIAEFVNWTSSFRCLIKLLPKLIKLSKITSWPWCWGLILNVIL